MTAAPFHLAANGLSGSQTIVEIGGPPFLLPLVDRSKIYDLVDISKKLLPNAKSAYICGAGAGPHPLINSNCEVSTLFQYFLFILWTCCIPSGSRIAENLDLIENINN